VSPAPTYVQNIQPSQDRINTAVAVYFATHPPRSPITASQVVAKVVPYVTAYLKAHPAPAGQPGKTGPSGAACTVQRNPDCQGPPGSPGPTGPPPSDQQVSTAVQAFLPAAVAEYLTANPPPSGPPGPTGPSGAVGPTGPAGPGPTQQQISDAVNDYFTAHPLACPDGYTAADETVVTDNGPVLIKACVADTQPTTPPPSTLPPAPTGSPTP